jgi:hypothetical protein
MKGASDRKRQRASSATQSHRSQQTQSRERVSCHLPRGYPHQYLLLRGVQRPRRDASQPEPHQRRDPDSGERYQTLRIHSSHFGGEKTFKLGSI